MGPVAGDDRLRRTFGNHIAAAVAALGSEVDQPVGRRDDVEIVLDHQQRVAGFEQLFEGPEQAADVLEVKAGGRFIEQEQGRRHGAGPIGAPACGGLGEVARQLQALGLAAGQCRHRLAQAEVLEADVGNRRERLQYCRLVAEEGDRLRDRQLEHLGDRLATPFERQDLRTIAPAVAIRASQVDVGQELHLDMLETRAVAGRATPVA